MARVPATLQLELIEAVQANDLPAATAAILAGASVNQRGPLALTPLHIACGRGYVQMVDKLIAAGADVHALDSSMGASALHFAAESGVTDVAQLLLDAGAFINLQSATVGLTPLINAIWSKQVAMVRFLLARGAAIEIKTHLGGASAWDFVGDGVLWTAGFTNPEKESWGREIRELLEARRTHDTAVLAGQKLMAAVQAGDLAAVRALIASGVDVNEKSPVVANGNDGQTPLLVASFLGHGEIVKALLAAGANPRINDYLLKATPIHKAAYAGRPEPLLALREDGGGEINAQGPYNGYTAMHDAVWHGHPDCLAVILDWPGARFDLVGFDGLTPEGLATRLGYTEMAQMIRAKQAALSSSPT
jgi:ankyrin repeat protein